MVHGIGVAEVCAHMTASGCAIPLRFTQAAPHGPEVVGILVTGQIGKDDSGGRVSVIVLPRRPPAERVNYFLIAAGLKGDSDDHRHEQHDGQICRRRGCPPPPDLQFGLSGDRRFIGGSAGTEDLDPR